jgi:hypothetical protein
MTKPLAVYYEHPDWFLPLFAELAARNINYLKLDALRRIQPGTKHKSGIWRKRTGNR